MRRSLAGKRILITGASGGIGRSLAVRAAARGALVAITGRGADRLRDVAEEIRSTGARVEVFAADLTCTNDRVQLITQIDTRLGGLDVLINNAGIGSFGHFIESSESILRQVMEVNFFAPAELTRLAIPLLKRGVQPAIVNVASMCGRRALPAWPEYSASKFALCGLSEALRAELVRFDIDVLTILPGLTRTELGSHLLRNAGRMKIDFSGGMPPEQVAQRVLRSLERNRPETVVGREAWMMLLVNRLWPRLVDRLTARKVYHLYEAEIRERTSMAAASAE